MKSLKDILSKNPEKQNRSNWLELSKKDNRGVPMPYPSDNPVHLVKLLRGEITEKENYMGIRQEGVMLFFEEDGVEKKYFVPKFVSDKNNPNYGKFDYRFERFADIEEGTDLELEFVRKGKAGFTRIDIVGHGGVSVDDNEIPIVEDDIDHDQDAVL